MLSQALKGSPRSVQWWYLPTLNKHMLFSVVNNCKQTQQLFSDMEVHLVQIALCNQVCMHLSPLLAQVLHLLMCFPHFTPSLSKLSLCSNGIVTTRQGSECSACADFNGSGTPVPCIVSLIAAAHQRRLRAAIHIRQQFEKCYRRSPPCCSKAGHPVTVRDSTAIRIYDGMLSNYIHYDIAKHCEVT